MNEKSHAQASRISMWSEPSKNYTYATNGVFANRSLDPVVIGNLVFITSGVDNETEKDFLELQDVTFAHPIQPCSSFTITPPDVIRGDGKRYSAENTYVDVLLIHFWDVNGKQWVRTENGKLIPVEGNFGGIADYKKVLGHRLDAFREADGVMQPDIMNSKGKPLEDCAAGS
ncbi:hypothetical protein [Streptomyces bugieae]|uniref:Uncharacterized protein n=1 Tax=Streptomyces bugieae TaxID=3098223 RepID=A0ABU7NL04_9ACTN|nr:hypothetical protein [Streptomyces sp. DSM 41528]